MEGLTLNKRRGVLSILIRGRKVGADARRFKSVVEKRRARTGYT